MWKPRRFTTLWAFTALYRDSSPPFFLLANRYLWLWTVGSERAVQNIDTVRLMADRLHKDAFLLYRLCSVEREVARESGRGQLKVLSQHLSRGSEGNYETPRWDTGLSGRKSKLSPFEHKTGMLSTQPHFLVIIFIKDHKLLTRVRLLKLCCRVNAFSLNVHKR
jgi:hypothetical protein